MDNYNTGRYWRSLLQDTQQPESSEEQKGMRMKKELLSLIFKQMTSHLVLFT